MASDKKDSEIKGTTVDERLSALYSNGSRWDVKFIVKDSEAEEFEYKAHRVVLAARSPVFAAMFYSGFAEARSEEAVIINDVPAWAFEMMLNFIYTDDDQLVSRKSGTNCEGLLFVALKYQVKRLIDVCLEHKRQSIDENNVISEFNSRPHWMPEDPFFKNFIRDNADSIVNNKQSGKQISYELLHSLVVDDNTNADEISLFNAIHEWMKAKKDEKKDIAESKEALELLRHVRFPLMNPEDLADVVAPSGLLSNETLVELFTYLGTNEHRQFQQSKPRKPNDEEKLVSEYVMKLQTPYNTLSRPGYCLHPVPLRDSRAWERQTTNYNNSVTQGTLFEDPITGKMYYWGNYTSNQMVQEWNSYDDFRREPNSARSIQINGGTRYGTYQAALGGYLYFQDSSGCKLAKADVKTGNVVCSLVLPSGTSTQYSWGGNTNVSLYVDRGNRLYALYGISGAMKLAQINTSKPDKLTVSQDWNVPRVKNTVGFCILMGGVLYFGQNYQGITISGRYILRSNTFDASFTASLGAEGTYISSASYSPKSNRLFVHDEMRQHMYENVLDLKN